MAFFSTWHPHRNRVLETRFISPYITKQQHQQKRNQSQKKKKKKTEDEEKKPEKIRPTQAAANPRPREPGDRVARAPSHTSSFSLSLWSDLTLSLSLSDLIWSGLPLSDLIWLFFSFWSDLIWWGEAALET